MTAKITLGATIACAVLAAFAASAVAGTRIVSPKNGRFVKGSEAKVVVHTSRHVASFHAWRETKYVTGSFGRHGKRWVARLPIKAGINHVYVKTKSASGHQGFDATRFIGAGRQAPGLVGATPLRVTRNDAPATATLSRSSGTEARARLNGDPVSGVFQQRQGQTYVARLGANDGLHFGENHLHVTVFDENGNYNVQSNRFKISRRAPLASAGRDLRARVGDRVQLNGRRSKLPRGGKRAFRWRVVSAPGSSPAQASATELTGADRSRPVLHARKPGTYEVQMSVRARGSHRASVDTVVVEVRPDDLPIGAPIKTLADANGTISIDGKPVSGTGAGGNTLSYTLLSRTTRMAPEGPAACKSSVPFFGTVASDVSGVKSLEGLVRDCNSPNYILILDGANGLDSGAADEFDKLLSMIGGDSLTDVDRSTITSACPFSVIGIPDAPETSAFTNFNSVGCGGTSGGQLSGYLQVSTATNEYGFVFPDYVPFDTHAENAPYHYNTMKVGGRSYRVSVMADGGFQTLVVDPRTLQPEADSNRDWITNTGDPAYDRNPDHLDELADYIQTQVIDRHRLLFLQSVGRPEPANTAWNDVADKIEALGGSRTVFNEISGNDSYAFVGGPGLTPAEASSTLVHPDTGARQPGHLQGVLSRTRTAEFAPTVSTTTGQVVQDVLPTVYGPAHSFQPFVGGEQAANAYFTKLIFGDKAKPLDMRAHYWLAFGDNWDGYRDRIHDATYAKAESECDCTSTEFTAVQAKLISEIDDLRDVKSWVGRLQAMVDPTQDLFNLNKVSLDIQRAVQPPDVEARNVDGVALISAGLAIGSSVFEEAAAPLSIAATLLGLYGGTQSGADGSELLGEIQTKTSDLGSQLLKRYTLAKSALTGIGQIVVSDPVKLKTVAANVRNDGSGWKLPTDLTPLTTAQNQGAKQWFYTALMPVAWARWELRGIANARYWYCFSTYPDEVQPWSNAPDSAQYKAVIGFVDDPRTGKVTPNRVVRALGIRVIPAFIDVPAPDGQALPPPGDLTNPLFKTPILDVGSNRLGLYPEQFYEEQFEPRGPVLVDRNCVHSG